MNLVLVLHGLEMGVVVLLGLMKVGGGGGWRWGCRGMPHALIQGGGGGSRVVVVEVTELLLVEMQVRGVGGWGTGCGSKPRRNFTATTYSSSSSSSSWMPR